MLGQKKPRAFLSHLRIPSVKENEPSRQSVANENLPLEKAPDVVAWSQTVPRLRFQQTLAPGRAWGVSPMILPMIRGLRLPARLFCIAYVHAAAPTEYPAMTTDSISDLVEALLASGLLTDEQQRELAPDHLSSLPDARSLLNALVERGWLSIFQADEVIAGRARELVLGQYVLLDRLGEGGMGQVFKARHQMMNRTVALKIIRPDRLMYLEPDRKQSDRHGYRKKRERPLSIGPLDSSLPPPCQAEQNKRQRGSSGFGEEREHESHKRQDIPPPIPVLLKFQVPEQRQQVKNHRQCVLALADPGDRFNIDRMYGE